MMMMRQGAAGVVNMKKHREHEMRHDATQYDVKESSSSSSSSSSSRSRSIALLLDYFMMILIILNMFIIP
jgi:hypothetical protein